MLKDRVRWVVAYAAVVLSAAFAARFGFKMADTPIDAWLRGGALGVVAIISCHGAAWAVRSWINNHRPVGVLIGLGSIVCFAVTLAGGTGTMATGNEKNQAERSKTIVDTQSDRAEIGRLRAQRVAMAPFSPMTQAGVDAAKDAVLGAAETREKECSEDRGGRKGKCRGKEDEEAARRAELVKANADKAATDRAAALETQIASIDRRLKDAGAVQNSDPQGATIARLLHTSPEMAQALYSALVPLALELGAMLAMLSAEINSTPAPRPAPASTPAIAPAAVENKVPAEPPPAPKLVTSNVVDIKDAKRKPEGKLEDFADARLTRKKGSVAGAKDIRRQYRAWCTEADKEPMPLDRFAAELKTLCKRRGLKLEDRGDDHVCLGVKLRA